VRLVERARDGDESAFSDLVDLDGDRCYAIAYRILRDVERAQDAVQQAFLLAWRELPRLRDPERFEVMLGDLLDTHRFSQFLAPNSTRRIERFVANTGAG